MMKTTKFIVLSSEADMRLDRWFKKHFPDLNYGKLQKLLRTGQIRVDSSRAKASTKIVGGQLVRVPPSVRVQKTKETLDHISDTDVAWIRSLVIHEDEALIVLNKPQGIPVQGGSKVTRHIDGLLSGLVEKGAEKPKLVHRLDRDTSGVLVVARDAKAAAIVGKIFNQRKVKKTYWALVAGVPRPRRGTINASLLKKAGADGYQKVVVDEINGQEALTEYSVLDSFDNRFAWISLSPLTGRTHQLRVHCASLGTPIIGDVKYGGIGSIVQGIKASQMIHLHARYISMRHPFGNFFRISAPLPDLMIRSWQRFDFVLGEGC